MHIVWCFYSVCVSVREREREREREHGCYQFKKKIIQSSHPSLRHTEILHCGTYNVHNIHIYESTGSAHSSRTGGTQMEKRGKRPVLSVVCTEPPSPSDT